MADDIRQWLKELGLGAYADAFEENRIGVDVLPDLADNDLKEIGVALGDRKRFLRAIEQLRDDEATATQNEAPEKSERRLMAAERRQLTVMFSDLVGSTVLSRQLDPEDLRDVMRRYQDAVSGAVTRYGGHVAKYLGDGMLVYFGWPKAYEDQAERAVRAGLDTVRIVKEVQIGDGRSLEARVGIATGQVVVGDLVGESGRDAEAVTGETPNLAARLQAVAEPGQVVIGDTTRQLIGQTFALNDLGEQDLKGFDEGLRAWNVVGEQAIETRFEAAHGVSLSKLVGRDGELQLLMDRWRLANHGEGQVVLICGEPGIGKSRLSQDFRDALISEDLIRARYQCSPYHTNSALYPTIQQLQNAAGFKADDNKGVKLDKLERLLRQGTDDDIDKVVPLIANLLSIPFEGRYKPLEQAPAQIKQQTLEAILDQMLHLAVGKPFLLLLEDAHWIDPTSLELVQLMVTSIQQSSVMIVITHRPEWQSPFVGHNHVTSLQLNRLGKEQGAKIVRAIAGDFVQDDIVGRIVSRTDGIPLFVEELTKSLVEGGLDLAEAEIPATLQGSLLARLDRLGGESKEVAQIAAVIGRQFSLSLLTAAGSSPAKVVEAMRRLTAAELIYEVGRAAETEYIFKHGLIKDAAYDSMLRDDRRNRHGALARILQERSGEPEMIAEHFQKAGDTSEAADYWYKAAQQAVTKSANLEASYFCEQAVSELRTLPETKENKRRLLAVLILELQPTMFLKGYSSPVVADRAERALVVCREVGSDAQLFRVLFYRWAPLHSSALCAPALESAEEYLSRAKAIGDSDAIIIGHRLIGTSLYMNGRWNEASQHLLYVVENYCPEKHDELAMQFGQDVLVTGQIYLGLTLWTQGWSKKALAVFAETIERATKLEHISTLGFAWFHLAVLRMLMRTQCQFRHEIRTIVKQANEVGHPYASGFSNLVVADTDFRESKVGLDAVERQIEDLIRQVHTHYGCQPIRQSAAETCMAQGRFNEAERLIKMMERDLDDGYEVYRESEDLRIRGDYHLLRGNFTEAEVCLAAALEWSKDRDAKIYELRAAMSMARLKNKQGKKEQAYALLHPLYDWFTEGFDTPDLKDAKALLDELT